MKMNYADPRSQEIVEGLYRDFTSNNSDLVKKASIDTTDYLRIRIREDGVLRRIITPRTITRGNIDRQQLGDLPISIIDMEPNSAGAMQIPFGDIPQGGIMNAPRFVVTYQRIASRRYQIDTMRLMTYNIDLRDMFNDLILKDLMDEEDRKGFAAFNRCVGTKNQVQATSGICQFVDLGPFSRSALTHLRKGLPSTRQHLEPGAYLMNNVTIHDFESFDRQAAGGDMAQTTLFGNATIESANGVKMVVTNKVNLCPDNFVWGFAPENFLGVFYILEDVVMNSEVKLGYLLEFGAHEAVGATIGNVAAVVKGEFANTAHDWRTSADESSSSI